MLRGQRGVRLMLGSGRDFDAVGLMLPAE